MDESILESIKKLLGVAVFDNSFDQDIIVDINSVLLILWQMGVGPSRPFRITGPNERWFDFIPDKDMEELEIVKSFIHLRVAQLFDPPQNSIVETSRKELIDELAWRLYTASDSDII